MKKLAHVLIVDDDQTSNFVTGIELKRHNPDIAIETVMNGEQAMEYIENGMGSYPHLILLDINLPLMSGWEFLNWFEDNGHMGKTKIAMFSTSSLRRDRGLCQDYSDVVAYIEKPLSEEKIATLVKSIN